LCFDSISSCFAEEYLIIIKIDYIIYIESERNDTFKFMKKEDSEMNHYKSPFIRYTEAMQKTGDYVLAYWY
jgi:hypothetical protein